LVQSISYKVLRKLEGVEIRRYPPIVIAKVDGYEGGGFNILFQYISGNNRQKAKVAMTAPVLSERIAMTAPVISGGGSLAFVMPERYSGESTPQPLDERVKIVDIPSRDLAALRFSGRWSDRVFGAKAKQLLDELGRAGLRSVGGVFSMRYNSPFTPWFMRRNEVAVEVEREGQDRRVTACGDPVRDPVQGRALRIRTSLRCARVSGQGQPTLRACLIAPRQGGPWTGYLLKSISF